MVIRRICPEDLDGFVTLWQSVFNEGIYLRSLPPSKDKIAVVLR